MEARNEMANTTLHERTYQAKVQQLSTEITINVFSSFFFYIVTDNDLFSHALKYLFKHNMQFKHQRNKSSLKCIHSKQCWIVDLKNIYHFKIYA